MSQFVPHLEKLVEDKLESSQRCAAEIISGIIRGSKHWEYEKIEKLWATLIPLLEKAITNISTETQTDWALCVTMGLESRDPNRHHWLLEYFLQVSTFSYKNKVYILNYKKNHETVKNVLNLYKIMSPMLFK